MPAATLLYFNVYPFIRLVFELFYFLIIHLLNNGAMNPCLDMLLVDAIGI